MQRSTLKHSDSTQITREELSMSNHHITLPPLRFAGDGMDFRRPVTTAAPEGENVIDLTRSDSSEERLGGYTPHLHPRPPVQPPVFDLISPPQAPARLPRYSREIIDLENETLPQLVQHNGRRAEEPAADGDEVQYLYSQPLVQPRLAPLRDAAFGNPNLVPDVPDHHLHEIFGRHVPLGGNMTGARSAPAAARLPAGV